ncbi:putative transporter SEO1 [Wickerhamomyces ciferrii]|uniref:Transporter SEO1 n=1 Tax=Wickerhamomyces ciferrii (strain ATCC 14091 / BCRC 22168 / CBS 111 / JCM 3599 / NBRC 0793 / NRRL Y-1031 F-60-10) TaxID=1206466 RepID=K0KEI3_WICCF|nr:putative transporter SEO1 [Wickerhamomyces ciferrii]CCH41316.1 putative transporter SEO1 [Wickerhamomyces ciferrii]
MSEKDLGIKDQIKVDVNESDGSSSVALEDINIPFKQKWKLFWSAKNPKNLSEKQPFFLWSPPGRSSYEKKLVFKLDCIILSYVCLSFFVRWLDASNVNNAYVSGMQEDLKMHGNMYNWLTRGFYLAYAVSGLPMTLLVTKVRPSILLPTLEILWGIVCLLVITCKTYKQILAVRVIQGFLEGVDLTKRSSLYAASGSLGAMFGGYIQSGVYRSLNNKGGLPGWKWIFVVDFIITIPIAILGFFIIPDTPDRPRVIKGILSAEDIEFCKERVKVVSVTSGKKALGFGVVKKLLTSWQFWLFSWYYLIANLPNDAGSYWGIVLKEQGYNVYQRNNIPTTQSAMNVFALFLGGIYCDFRGVKWDGAAICHGFWLVGIAILVKYDVPQAVQFLGFILVGFTGICTNICCTWAQEMTREDPQLRAGTLGMMNLALIPVSTVFSLFAFNTKYAPRFEKGTRICLVFLIISFFTGFVALAFDRYQRRKRDLIEEKINGETPEDTEVF